MSDNYGFGITHEKSQIVNFGQVHPSIGLFRTTLCDVGHAQVNENLGLEKHSAFLEKYAKHMVGMHIHDIDGSQDHLAPGMGNFDFTILKPYLKKNTIKVLEIHQPATAVQVKAGVSYLNGMGLAEN